MKTIDKHEGENIGLYDTALSSKDYQATFENIAESEKVRML